MATTTMLARDLTAQALGHKIRLKQAAHGRDRGSEIVGTLVAVVHRWSGLSDERVSRCVVEVLGQEIDVVWEGFEEIEFVEELA